MIKLFADDTSLYLIIDNPQTTADILNRDLDKIHTWSANWLVSFNPQKTKTKTISRKINKPHHPDIFMNDTPIAEVPNHKHLGLNSPK
jgi:ABC-type antimicrobial peptide transport system ATPase subunit